VNPFLFLRCEVTSPHRPEAALDRLDRLVREGFDAEGRHYRLFGGRHGRFATMSLGLPIVGGAAPVLRAWVRADAIPTTFDVNVGARMELIVLGGFWLLLTLVGGGYQLLLQLREVAAGRAGWNAVTDVLPGIALMLGILALAFWLHRRRAATDAGLMLTAFREAVGEPPVGVPATAPPLH